MTIYEQLGKRKILLVVADRWIRDSLSLLFECGKCRVAVFDNTAESLRVVEAEGFDIIICDSGSPGIDGVAFLEQAGKIRPESVRILIAGYPVGEIASAAARAGIHQCLPKPFTLDILEETLRGLAGKFLPEEAARTAGSEGKVEIETG